MQHIEMQRSPPVWIEFCIKGEVDIISFPEAGFSFPGACAGSPADSGVGF